MASAEEESQSGRLYPFVCDCFEETKLIQVVAGSQIGAPNLKVVEHNADQVAFCSTSGAWQSILTGRLDRGSGSSSKLGQQIQFACLLSICKSEPNICFGPSIAATANAAMASKFEPLPGN